MSHYVGEHRPSPLALALLALSAVCLGIAGYEHGGLYHRGYAEVSVVGPLFLLNAIATAVVILLLVFGRTVLYVAGALVIALGSLVSIFISHSSSFFGFAEGGYDGSAKLIVATEIAAAVLAVAGLVAGGARRRAEVTA